MQQRHPANTLHPTPQKNNTMTYDETLQYLYNSLPMYHRIGQAAYKADIANTVSLMQHLGHPEQRFRSIHVAGTNGKGSVSHMLASILMQAGYKVGLYTSPHLVDFRERIRINGAMIPQEEVTRFVETHKDYMQTLQLSFFEMTVGLAFDHFASQQVEVAVVEVGMGGRLDSTNVITPDLSIITNIGLDHTQFLGDTLPKIAAEKAGIIKPHIPVVIGETHPETRPVFQRAAAAMQSPIHFADDHYRIIEQPAPPSLSPSNLHFTVHHRPGTHTPFAPLEPQTVYTCPLSGSYQLHNLATLFQALELLPAAGYTLSGQHIRDGIARVVTDTGLHGRWETVDTQPLTICETAHNADGIAAMLGKLATLPYRQLHLVYGCVNDKDYMKILHMLPHGPAVHYYYTQPSVPRALPVAQLAGAAAACGMAGEAYPAVGEAIRAARAAAQPDTDLVLVTGSIFLVADAVEYYSRTTL